MIKFFWADGALEVSSAIAAHHMNLYQRLVDKRKLPSGTLPGDYVAGHFNPETDKLDVVWRGGQTPDDIELKFILKRELEQYMPEHQRVPIAATVEDTEPAHNFSFLQDPHKELYPCAFENSKMRPEAIKTLKAHVLSAIENGVKAHADTWIAFSVYGSGASYNWDEAGDFDVQMWVDIDTYNEEHKDNPMTGEELLVMVRRAVQTVNFPSFKDLGLDTPECEGKMLIQFYPKLGKGTREENLASKPYACYDLDTDEWLQRPEPIDAKFYGEYFLLVQTKAEDIAKQAEGLLASYQRHIIDWQFWNQMFLKYHNPTYREQTDKAQTNATLEKEAIANLFQGVFGGRQKAYSEEGEGYKDERDLVQKLLEVWGIFQELKHFARAPLPWEEQAMPGEAEVAEVVDALSEKSSMRKVSEWQDLMEKAQRLRSDGAVTIMRNAPDHVVGEVQGDTGTYMTEIWRDDPESQAITMWDCECPWSDYSWGRTRQWKKYEGRPCSHTLALFWEAQGQPIEGEDAELPEQTPPIPVPGGPPVQQQGLIQQVPGLIAPAPTVPLQPEVPTVPPAPAPMGPPPAPRQPSIVKGPNDLRTPLDLPGAFSHRYANIFRNGDIVRARFPLYGEEPTSGAPHTVPQNAAGEVMYSDDEETVVIFPLGSGPLGPHLVKVYTVPENVYLDRDSNPFIKRRSSVVAALYQTDSGSQEPWSQWYSVDSP